MKRSRNILLDFNECRMVFFAMKKNRDELNEKFRCQNRTSHGEMHRIMLEGHKIVSVGVWAQKKSDGNHLKYVQQSVKMEFFHPRYFTKKVLSKKNYFSDFETN